MSLRLIQRFGRTLTVIRPGTGSYVDGNFVPGNELTLSIFGSKQPLTGEEQELLPEGNDEKESFKVYSVEPLNIQKALTANQVQSADQIEFEGNRFQVIGCEPHTHQVGMTISYYKITCVAVGGEA